MGRAYNCWILNLLVHNVTSRLWEVNNSAKHLIVQRYMIWGSWNHPKIRNSNYMEKSKHTLCILVIEICLFLSYTLSCFLYLFYRPPLLLHFLVPVYILIPLVPFCQSEEQLTHMTTYRFTLSPSNVTSRDHSVDISIDRVTYFRFFACLSKIWINFPTSRATTPLYLILST